MSIFNKIFSKVAVLFLGVVSVIFIFLPFNTMSTLSFKSISEYVNIINGNYLYSILGVILFMLSMISLFSGVKTNSNRSSHIVTYMNFGDLRISDEAIKGLTHNIISKIIGIRDSKIIVNFIEGYVIILIKGQVSPDINIPEVAKEIQDKVKETIENNTGIEVKEVNVEVVAISSPMKALK
ncbi:hypothetical protein DUF322 [Gottschalkia acidurici 9a]|uniref:Alkaline shock response membrane anchor protein AmaP n=1 Tax=Gottschalkia acidurici (strain ATCC 7906 / DSM 604 / BCRC 14475 / CIP 104303 / KCTC 5404 / NCIMB 10678 / 9a) TaxID=1128398 RepID=K0B190_GOTA9|nr:alkaline shock response membrane anchor protein AmaP [Gottschalkia acidurici]AFS78391.1 hypothetical protein DUF322 [Gottschalkia acidurici 9a]